MIDVMMGAVWTLLCMTMGFMVALVLLAVLADRGEPGDPGDPGDEDETVPDDPEPEIWEFAQEFREFFEADLMEKR